jgi:hypothetical protein
MVLATGRSEVPESAAVEAVLCFAGRFLAFPFWIAFFGDRQLDYKAVGNLAGY